MVHDGFTSLMNTGGVPTVFEGVEGTSTVFTILKPQLLVPKALRDQLTHGSIMESAESGGTIHYKHYEGSLLKK